MTAAPAWLVAAADQRIALMKQAMLAPPPGYTTVMLLLTEPPEGSSRKTIRDWDITCDNCRKVTNTLNPGTIEEPWKGANIVLVFGACNDCMELP